MRHSAELTFNTPTLVIWLGIAAMLTVILLAIVAWRRSSYQWTTGLLELLRVLLVGLAVVTLMILPILAVLPMPSFAGLASMFGGAARWAASWMVAGAALWEFSISIAVKTALVVSTPQALLFLAASLGVGLAAASALHALVTQDRSSFHAKSI
jgi:hypothetical protein